MGAAAAAPGPLAAAAAAAPVVPGLEVDGVELDGDAAGRRAVGTAPLNLTRWIVFHFSRKVYKLIQLQKIFIVRFEQPQRRNPLANKTVPNFR